MKSLTNRKFQPVLSWTLLVLTCAECQFLAAVSMAAPVVTASGHFTDRRGPHSHPSPVGDYVQLYALLDSSDPIGSPTISVEVSQGGTTVTLDPAPPGSPLFEGLHLYFTFIDFDPDLTGSWEITATDSTGTGPSAFTNTIAEPEFLPLVEDVTLQGTPLGATVSWTVPDLTGFDVEWVNVRVFTASGSQLWQSDLFSPQITSFTAPAGILQGGVDYVYSINLQDAEGGNLGYIENISRAYSTPFFYTVPGDYSGDGTVGPEDYDLWKANFGSTTYPHADGNYDGGVNMADYTVWRDHLGASPIAGAGIGEAAAVPELASVVLAALALVATAIHSAALRFFRTRSEPRS